MEDICSFFGHSEIEITENLKESLKQVLEELINKNCTVFYFGGLGMFDYLCWQMVTQLKQKYSFIKRVFCLKNPKHKNKFNRPSYLNSNNYEEIIYLDLDFDFYYTRIYYRNIEMLKKSKYIIFYVEHMENSGAYKVMKYARLKNKNYINLAKCNIK